MYIVTKVFSLCVGGFLKSCSFLFCIVTDFLFFVSAGGNAAAFLEQSAKIIYIKNTAQSGGFLNTNPVFKKKSQSFFTGKGNTGDF